ncbi:hypothetical protein PENSPDRAFT_120432 [Peniophora sp. CONT]|nr:hypothetical protein PENSPDRAFT_120432 [Peniophora sp. CONT]
MNVEVSSSRIAVHWRPPLVSVSQSCVSEYHGSLSEDTNVHLGAAGRPSDRGRVPYSATGFTCIYSSLDRTHDPSRASNKVHVANAAPPTPEISRTRACGTRPRSNALSARRLSVPDLSANGLSSQGTRRALKEPASGAMPAHLTWSSTHVATRRVSVAFAGWRDPDFDATADSDVDHDITSDCRHSQPHVQCKSSPAAYTSEPSYVWMAPEQDAEKDVCMMDMDRTEGSEGAKPAHALGSYNVVGEADHTRFWEVAAQGYQAQEMMDEPMDET